MFKAFNLFNPEPEAPQPPQSSLQLRLMAVIDQYSQQIPPIARPLLNAHLQNLSDRMTDDVILSFVAKTRELLNFIETGAEGTDEECPTPLD